MGKDTFYIEEYKSLREEINTKLKERLEYNRWGLVGLAALYSYLLSHPGNPILFWVPFCLSVAMIVHFNEEHRMVANAATYINTQIERWAAGGDAPQGWENYLQLPGVHPPWWIFWRRWPARLWNWTPVPLWLAVFGLTLVIAGGVSAGLWPSLTTAPVSCSKILPG